METTKTEVNWSEVNREEAELACLGDMCSWKEADQFQRVIAERLLIRETNLQPHLNERMEKCADIHSSYR